MRRLWRASIWHPDAIPPNGPAPKHPRLPARHRAWIVAKLTVVFWLVVYAIVTPPATAALLGSFVWVWVGVAVAGVLGSIAGMFTAVRARTILQQRVGRVVELSGLIVAAAGPLIHAITLIGLMITAAAAHEENVFGRLGPMLQSVVIAAFLAVRYVEVRTRPEVMR